MENGPKKIKLVDAPKPVVYAKPTNAYLQLFNWGMKKKNQVTQLRDLKRQ